MKIWKMVAESTPNTTAIPISEREFAPAPVERASGMLPTMKGVHQVERTETEHDRLLEVGEEHSHEADAGEIVDVSLRFSNSSTGMRN